MKRHLSLLLVGLTALSINTYSEIDCADSLAFTNGERERIGYHKSVELLEEFYDQFTEKEVQEFHTKLTRINSLSISVDDLKENPELRALGINASKWNDQLVRDYKNLVPAALDKFIASKGPSSDGPSRIDKDEHYMMLDFGEFVGGSPKFPVAIYNLPGYRVLERSAAKENQLRLYSLGINPITEKVEGRFFVSRIDTNDSKAFSGKNWKENQIIFNNFGEYLYFAFRQACPKKN